MLSANDAARLCRLLNGADVRFWVMGGWGVDALLGRETRPHKDLDILVMLEDLPLLWRLLARHGFSQVHVWEESRPVPSGAGELPSAFVAADRHGRMVDVHVISLGPDNSIVQHYEPQWPVPASLTAPGVIDGYAVPCVSLAAQRAMHTGYALPETHRYDVELLANAEVTSRLG
jgi:lincosamide nucleotidyltransferase A/C/D/E